MGYYSDVKSVVYGPTDKVKAYVVAYKLKAPTTDALEEFEVHVHTRDDQTYLSIEGNWKWYDAFEDIIAWAEFMKESEEFGLMWEFARLGEERGDVEYEASEERKDLVETRESINMDIPSDTADAISLQDWATQGET